jgi:hypothetical protein
MKGVTGFVYHVLGIEHMFDRERGCKLEWKSTHERIDREIAYFGAQNPSLTWDNDEEHAERIDRLYESAPLNPARWPEPSKPPSDLEKKQQEADRFAWMPTISIYVTTFEALNGSGWCIATVETTVKMWPAFSSPPKLEGTGREVHIPTIVVWGPSRRVMRTTSEDLLPDILHTVTETLKDLVIDWASVQKDDD